MDRNISYIISREILEYDMASAGFNIIKKYKLLEDKQIKRLTVLNKKERQYEIGLIIRKNKQLGTELNNKFVEIRKWFFEQNNLKNEDILSIKKDAIITFKRCYNLTLTNIEFIEKNSYTSYYYINKKEFYFNSFNNTIDVKGISDEKLLLHNDGFLVFLSKMFRMLEIADNNRIIIFLKSFLNSYKNYELDVSYYRELNSDSMYRMKDIIDGKKVFIKDIDRKFLHNIDISFNYVNYIIYFIQFLI